jgi:uridine kinase
MTRKEAVIIGLAGGTASGKTTIAREICVDLGPGKAVLLQLDSYYFDRGNIPLVERNQCNFDHPSAFDWDLLKQHLRTLRQGRAIEKPLYDYQTHARLEETILVEPRPLLILEGILVLHDPEVLQMMDLAVWVDGYADVRFIRRLERDVRDRGRSMESVIEQYLSTVRPMHLQYVEPSKQHADIIIPEGESLHRAGQALIAAARSMIMD